MEADCDGRAGGLSCSSSAMASHTLGCLRKLRMDGSGLLLSLRDELTEVTYCLLSSGEIWPRLVVGEGKVDLDEGVAGASLEPASDGS